MPRESNLILAHGDCDGVCSAALALRFLGEGEIFFTHPSGLLEDLIDCEKHLDPKRILILDIAIDERFLDELSRKLKSLAEESVEIIYVDHHPSTSRAELPPGIDLVVGEASTSELSFKRFGLGDPESERIALMGAIGDYSDQTEWVKRRLDDWDKRHLYFEAGILSLALEGSRRLYDFKRRVARLLASGSIPSSSAEILARAIMQAQNTEELRSWVRENVRVRGSIAYVLDPEGSVGVAANYARIYGGARVGIACERRKGLCIMSLRTSDPRINLEEIVGKIARSLGGSGGGHRSAAGARIPEGRFEDFIEMLDREIRQFQS